MMDFDTYCKKKKVDPDQFKKKEPEMYTEWKRIYEQVSEASFTQQKLFLINPLRLKYKYEGPEPESTEKKPAMPKPVMKATGTKTAAPKVQPKMSGIKPKVVIKPGNIKPGKK